MEIQGLLCLKKKCVPVLMRKRTNLKYVEHELQREKKKKGLGFIIWEICIFNGDIFIILYLFSI